MGHHFKTKIVNMIDNPDMNDEIYACNNINELEYFLSFIKEKADAFKYGDKKYKTQNADFINKCFELLEFCISDIDDRNLFEILIKYIDIDMQNVNGTTLLMSTILDFQMLALGDDVFDQISRDIIMYILDYTKNINLHRLNGMTALNCYMSAMNRPGIKYNKTKYDVVVKMLELGADIFHDCTSNVSAFSIAVRINNYNLVKLLLDNADMNGKNIGKIDARDIYNAFEQDDNYDIIELLLQYVDDINECFYDDEPILKGCHKTYDISPNIIELLTESGARL